MAPGVYRNSKMWNVLRKGEENGGAYAAFTSRKFAIEWLNFKKEQHFFETGNMEEAEELWATDNFRFEESMVIYRNSIVDNFKVDFNDWNFEL
jgi:hypothetical protein